VQTLDDKVESLTEDLPDAPSARRFFDNLLRDHPQVRQKFNREVGLLSDVLTLAAYSPLLATTLEQNPDYISWLARERTDTRVRSCDQLRESLARFSLTNSSLTPAALFARFRRRELLRIYLHDVRRAHTLVETTEELSNLADAILDYALSLARQELDNKYGSPLSRDTQGRNATADFCVVALGKHGSRELNYASDIDLVFLYSDDGMTASSSEHDQITNREYFGKLAEKISKLVGHPAGEPAAYRVDLRLRPYGRDGALACSLNEATNYYAKSAQAWERQALIRSRSAAGSVGLFNKFAAAVQPEIYRAEVSVSEALASVRLAKQKIDRQVERKNSGFNVKLQRGGIREIEFIAQALQLAHGGHDEWLRVAHTLICLGRLTDRHLISETERSELSEAYLFLRNLEHRLQMEHGLQTHTVPQGESQRRRVARRVGFVGPTALAQFDAALVMHTDNVRRVYERVFAQSGLIDQSLIVDETISDGDGSHGIESKLSALAANKFHAHLTVQQKQDRKLEGLVTDLRAAAERSANPQRALLLAARIAASLEKADVKIEVSFENLKELVRLCGASEFFGEIVASNPALITELDPQPSVRRHDYRALMRSAIDPEKSFSAELSALRREWLRLLIEIGAQDAAGSLPLATANELQTQLAIDSINVAYLIARRELARRYGKLQGGPRLAILALGRLASGGVDYGSDLDLVLVYDSLVSSPIPGLTPDEAYARLCELMIAALASVTREGYLYRVDLRLRPNGKDGPLVSSSEGFLDYVRHRSAIWEWLAYVKLRAVAGDLELGRMIETHARHAIHEKASAQSKQDLQAETRRVRERLESEKGRRFGFHGRQRSSKDGAASDIKYSAGSMLDVYFAVRYLQLRDDVSDEGDDRSTLRTLERLHANGSLERADYETLSEGYELLRTVDHHLRLILGKVSFLPPMDYPVFKEIAARMGFATPRHFADELRGKMKAVREVYDQITSAN